MKKVSIGVLFVLFLTITILVITNNITSFDDALYNSIIYFRNDFSDTLFKTITFFGNTIPVLCITILLLIFLNKKEKNILGLSVLTIFLSNQLLKHTIRRIRPDHIRLIKQTGFSYPSGHAMISIALYGFLIYYVYKHINNKYLKVFLMSFLILLIIGIGCSRIYVGVHYPSDVLGGYCLSLCLLSMVIHYGEKLGGDNHDKNDR